MEFVMSALMHKQEQQHAHTGITHAPHIRTHAHNRVCMRVCTYVCVYPRAHSASVLSISHTPLTSAAQIHTVACESRLAWEQAGTRIRTSTFIQAHKRTHLVEVAL